MTISDTILQTINQQSGNVCDDCMTPLANLNRRQVAFSRCTELAAQGMIHRYKGVWDVCGKTKNVSCNLGAIPPPKPSPVVEPNIPNNSQSMISSVDPSQSWYWEGNVQSALITHLTKSGYSIRSVANTATRAPGKDIICITPEKKELWISVKGYPQEGNPHRCTQARHWFAKAIFDLLLYHDENPDVQLAVAFPDGFKTYQGLANRNMWTRTSLPCTIFWVADNGSVRTK